MPATKTLQFHKIIREFFLHQKKFPSLFSAATKKAQIAENFQMKSKQNRIK